MKKKFLLLLIVFVSLPFQALAKTSLSTKEKTLTSIQSSAPGSSLKTGSGTTSTLQPINSGSSGPKLGAFTKEQYRRMKTFMRWVINSAPFVSGANSTISGITPNCSSSVTTLYKSYLDGYFKQLAHENSFSTVQGPCAAFGVNNAIYFQNPLPILRKEHIASGVMPPIALDNYNVILNRLETEITVLRNQAISQNPVPFPFNFQDAPNFILVMELFTPMQLSTNLATQALQKNRMNSIASMINSIKLAKITNLSQGYVDASNSLITQAAGAYPVSTYFDVKFRFFLYLIVPSILQGTPTGLELEKLVNASTGGAVLYTPFPFGTDDPSIESVRLFIEDKVARDSILDLAPNF